MSKVRSETATTTWGGARIGAGGPKRHLHLSFAIARILDRLVRYERALGVSLTTPETIVERLVRDEAERQLREHDE